MRERVNAIETPRGDRMFRGATMKLKNTIVFAMAAVYYGRTSLLNSDCYAANKKAQPSGCAC
jgi:hypothetical protein